MGKGDVHERLAIGRGVRIDIHHDDPLFADGVVQLALLASGSGAAVALAFWKLLQRILDKDRKRLLTAWITVVVATGVVYSILENQGVKQIWAIAIAAAAGLLLVIMWYIRITIAKRTTF